ncbi:MAG: hypothetical protein RLZZ01_1301 [Actinomycetota bacterium]
MQQTTDQTIIDPAVAADLINTAPSYDEFVITTDRDREIVLMARDFPREGRRCTCITTGTEWFNITADSLMTIGFVSMRERVRS